MSAKERNKGSTSSQNLTSRHNSVRNQPLYLLSFLSLRERLQAFGFLYLKINLPLIRSQFRTAWLSPTVNEKRSYFRIRGIFQRELLIDKPTGKGQFVYQQLMIIYYQESFLETLADISDEPFAQTFPSTARILAQLKIFLLCLSAN